VSRGAAGRRGADVRSDAWVEIELGGAGGIEIAVTSRVEAYYGAAIRQQVRQTLARLGVADARVSVEDQGALPFCLGARIEAACLRAGVRPAAPPGPPPRPAAPRDRLRRSRLYLPGNEPKFMQNAGLYGADGLILDLEDSVHPAEKDAARLLVREALATLDFGRAERMVRINQLPLGLDDLEAVVPAGVELILIPKVEDPDQVRAVDERIRALAGPREVWLMPILESALGIERAFEVAQAGERVVALTLGLEDLAADLGVPRSAGGEESLYARLRVVHAARAAGREPIDSVYGQVDDVDGLRAWGARAKGLGFAGMGCVHPRQIEPIHEAFRPSAAELERAAAIVAAFEQARAEHRAVISLGSKMIDPPVVEQALRLVRRAREMGSA